MKDRTAFVIGCLSLLGMCYLFTMVHPKKAEAAFPYPELLHEVTWYQDGEIAANGDKFEPKGYTCAVRSRRDWKHWIRLEYQGRVVYCYANDRMPEGSRAEYDLTPAAFARLAPLRQGRLKGVKVEVVE
jgi:hypothetical protein